MEFASAHSGRALDDLGQAGVPGYDESSRIPNHHA